MMVHIGFPNCASTTLQVWLSRHHSRFLGCDPKRPVGEFYDAGIGEFFESVLRFGSNAQFRREADGVREFLAARPEAALSCEHIAFRLTPWDLPTDIKLERLGQILPTPTTVILLFRPVQDTLLTYYQKLCLGWGYTGDIAAFLAEVRVLENFGWIADLDLEQLVGALECYLPGQDIALVNLKQPDSFRRLARRLGIAPPDDTHGALNQSPAPGLLPAIRQANLQHPPRKQLLDWLEVHRTFPAAPIKESDKFHLARQRRQISQRLQSLKPSPFALDDIDWPDTVLAVEARNQAFLNKRPELSC